VNCFFFLYFFLSKLVTSPPPPNLRIAAFLRVVSDGETGARLAGAFFATAISFLPTCTSSATAAWQALVRALPLAIEAMECARSRTLMKEISLDRTHPSFMCSQYLSLLP